MKDNTYIPSWSSPKGGKRACLCKDTDKYSIKCCNGDLQEQGIGIIQRTAEYLLTENREIIITENDNDIIL